ncbi:uncharacterized protein LOC130784719 isoform X2 [Actinidia eriantha]|uniref:uncharacterized protein LOC130784719 isoform X2 n=1 Tax=Actinidia eriantha TaxID=165200 RepID=UPI00259040E8|nr:uncharacterized protein LOC130784719 isoform X2 [Actinidia eriantha]
MRSANPKLAAVYSLQNSLVSDGKRKPLSLSEAALSFSHQSRLKANAGALTNFEVLDFLRSRGAAKDPTRVIVSVAPSEFKIIEQCEKRLGESVEELVELVAVVFPAPAQTEPDEAAGEDNEEIPDGQQMDAS